MLSRSIPRATPRCNRAAFSRATFLAQRNAVPPSRTASASASKAGRMQQHLVRSILAIAFAGTLATGTQYYLNNGRLLSEAHAEAPPAQEIPAVVVEKSRKKKGASKEENRDLISSQHLQVKRSWENPGVYAWGSNAGKVVAPDSDEAFIKTPRRITFFDGKLLRDIKLDRNFGVAIDESGDLLQWGGSYSLGVTAPTATLRGKNLVKLTLSKDRILGLSSNGKVYSIPVSAEDQETGAKPTESSWIPFWTGRSPISYRTIEPKDLSYGERVRSIAGGLEHALLLTSKGRLFSTASASDSFPTRGQLGVPGLTWLTRPPGPFDAPHEITTLKGFEITKLACGDHHSLVLDREGRVFTFGDNSSGQLGFAYNPESAIVDAPSLLPTQKPYAGTSQVPTVTAIAAGGSTSYLTIDALKVASQADPTATRGLGRITADTFAFGAGILGNLGNSRWTHVQPIPTRIPTLSGLFEYDEARNVAVPIRLAHLSVGATHAAAVMANITVTSIDGGDSADSTNWGADIVFWGGNEHYQLGTGKRNNVATPVYIQPLDLVAERMVRGKEEHRFQITPRSTARLGDGRRVSVEQRVECGRGVTCVYSGT